ncbi:MAG: hypothetical protein LQ342_002363 [Letrouitia transgressa]|nr:MAG: hypothetical protein LQ342_002363 [Letrouitia transgressa]
MSEISPEDEATVLGPMSEQAGSPSTPMQPQKAVEELNQKRGADEKIQDTSLPPSANKHSSLATPAVRGLLKELKVNIEDIRGTGKDGRVLKEDVHRFAAARSDTTFHFSTHHIAANSQTKSTSFPTEHTIPLTAIQSQMFKTMTRSLQIPHFVYADEIDITALSSLRRRLNNASPHPQHQGQSQKLTYLPFILKAVSLALYDFPLLNARVDTASPDKPQLIMRASHNIGIAMDTPQGLLVPNIKSVNNLSIAEIAVEISRLQSLALSAKLTAQDLTGGTITVSNIGSIGGTYVSPVIVSNEVAILGIGKARAVPRFDDGGEVVRKEVVNFSWSADHRVVDGATMARCAERVRGWLEGVEGLLVQLR